MIYRAFILFCIFMVSHQPSSFAQRNKSPLKAFFGELIENGQIGSHFNSVQKKTLQKSLANIAIELEHRELGSLQQLNPQLLDHLAALKRQRPKIFEMLLKEALNPILKLLDRGLLAVNHSFDAADIDKTVDPSFQFVVRHASTSEALRFLTPWFHKTRIVGDRIIIIYLAVHQAARENCVGIAKRIVTTKQVPIRLLDNLRVYKSFVQGVVDFGSPELQLELGSLLALSMSKETTRFPEMAYGFVYNAVYSGVSLAAFYTKVEDWKNNGVFSYFRHRNSTYLQHENSAGQTFNHLFLKYKIRAPRDLSMLKSLQKDFSPQCLF